MKNFRVTRNFLILAVFLFSLSSLVIAQQNALKLEWVLSGPAINGTVPTGRAVLDQPSLPGKLRVEIKNVNLPNGTPCSFIMGTFNAGTLVLNKGEARLEASIPFQFRNGAIEVVANGSVIMTGRFKN